MAQTGDALNATGAAEIVTGMRAGVREKAAVPGFSEAALGPLFSLFRVSLGLGVAVGLVSCVYDPGVSYHQPAPVYTRPTVTYTAPPPPPTPRYYSPRYVPPPTVTYTPSYSRPTYRPPVSVQFYYSLPRGASYVSIRGNPCWFYNGCYYRRNPRGSGFVLFVP